MAIRQRKDRGGKWQVYWRNPYTKKQESALFATQKEAAKADALVTYKLKWEPEAFRPVEKKSEPGKPVYTLKEVIDKYFAAKRFTYEARYRLQFKKVLSILGEKPISDITIMDLSDLMCAMSEGAKSRTVFNKMGYVMAVFRWAYKSGYIDMLPRFPERPKWKPRELVPPTREQVERLLHFAQPHIQRVIVLGTQLGCRVGPSELTNIRWSDFDFQRNVLILRASAKNRREPIREIPIKESLVPLLKRWMENDMTDNMPWVIHLCGKHVVNIWGSWNTLLEKAGFEHRQFRPYDLRHAFATEAISAGADIGTVSRLMGHAQVSTTLTHYQHVMTKQKRIAIESLPDVPSMPSLYAQGKCTNNVYKTQ